MSLFENHICVCNLCKVSSTESNPTGKGKETTFRLLNINNKVVDKYILDDCVLKDYTRSEKCDYMFNVSDENIVFVVECKGADILKAVSQIESSINILKDSLIGKKIKGRIVSTKVYSPNIRDRNYSRLRERLNKDLIVKNTILEETI